ncbi:MAG TPA: PAS domain-containing sensor histidine kinase [Cytophagaceae bacterium]|jgi:hypothetical protein
MKHSTLPGQNGNFPVYISDVKGFAIFMMDVNGIITSWNEGCELMKGFTAEDAIGSHFEMLFPDFLKAMQLPYKELDIAYEKGRYETENWRVKKNGELFWAHVVLTKVLDEANEFIGFIKITQDHTRKKHLEDEVRRKNDDLEKLNEELTVAKEKINADLDSFIYTASHDLRTPISNMEGLLVELREHECSVSEETGPLINYLYMCVERLKKTIGELTEINKIQKSIQVEVQEISIEETVEEVKAIIKELIQKSDAIVEVDVQNCPLIKFSSRDFRTILYNLISNGIKYGSPERRPKIRITSDFLGGYYVINVSDNGLGIEDANKDKVFNMFKRFHDHVEGTGIGLYMVKRIIDNAGGRIELESELGVGSTFRIFLKSS